MTEATHQMASNPLNGKRKPGSVGLAAGPEIAIMDESRQSARAGHDRRGRHSRAERDVRLREQCEGQWRGVCEWLVPHRRSGGDRRRRLPDTDRTAEGDHQSRRREGFPARGRRGAYGSSRRPAGRGVRNAARHARRGCGRGRRPARGRESERAGASRVPPRTPRAIQSAAKIFLLPEIPKGSTGKLQRIGLAQKLGARRDSSGAASSRAAKRRGDPSRRPSPKAPPPRPFRATGAPPRTSGPQASPVRACQAQASGRCARNRRNRRPGSRRRRRACPARA